MREPGANEVTQILVRITDGDERAADELLPLVYAELRAIAGRYFRGQPWDHTLQPTALVHEAFIRLAQKRERAFNDRAHFLAVAATAMRQIMINYAERRSAQKRGGGRNRVQLRDAHHATTPDDHILALDEALAKLARFDERKSRVVELRFFGGMTHEEIASVLGVSLTTIESDWRGARAWIARLMTDDGDAAHD